MADNTLEEQYKFDVITKVLEKKIKPGLAAKMLGVSTRQVRRLRNNVKQNGIKAVVHGLKDRKGNHKIELLLKDKALSLIQKHYSDFKPTFATEKLWENHGIALSPETTRLWMKEKGIWKTRKQKKTGKYHAWRPRKEYFGEFEQFDGSYHMWFEDRFVDEKGSPIETCLLASIDDATGKITKAAFLPNEGVRAVFIFWKDYVREHGKPLIIYLDAFSTYKISHKSALDNKDLITQFERAMQQLSIHPITAHSPEAKGRVERLFQTLQDRLVKEMRLACINTPDAGNRFLKDVYLPKFNERFAVAAAKAGDVHKDLTESDKKNLDRIFSVQSERVINNDFTIQFKNNWYQLAEIQPTTVRAKEKVLVEEWLDSSLHFSLREKYLNYSLLPGRPKRAKKNSIILTRHKLNWIPPEDHPWRKPYKPDS